MIGRPHWQARSREQAENFFLDALSAWHKELKLGKMVLMGHSLGGYLAATYALRHPEDVQHLILVCPAGLVRVPGVLATNRFATVCVKELHEAIQA